jgi:hypothetical protein
MARFNHAYTFGFSLESDSEDGTVSAEELRRAIMLAVAEMSDTELRENCGFPFDSYEIAEAA